MKPLDVVGVRLEVPSNQPVVLLRESGTNRHLPIWIGTAEATAIAIGQSDMAPARPLTHDLLLQVISALGDRLTGVDITRVEDGVFYADLVLESGITIGARPSDAIALALREDVPVRAADEVLDQAGVEIESHEMHGAGPAGSPDSGETPAPLAEEELQKFREFLADVSPEDFGGPEQPPES